jgi:glycosyltransferase involved in cell wall biosynthesis
MKARVLMDATGVRIGGGFTYLVSIIPRLCEREPDLQIRLLIRHQALYDAIPNRPNLEVINLPPAGIAERLRYVYFEIPRIARSWGADLFYSVGEMVPLRLPCPSIASFRNAFVFTRDISQLTLRDRLRVNLLRLLGRISAARATRVMFVSKASADWIRTSIGLPAERTAVVHHGIDASAWSNVAPYRGHPRPYILSVGSIYVYKNFVRLIEAYLELARRNPDAPDLILIGDEVDADHRAQMDRVKQASGALSERIHILGAMPHREVQNYYAGARLFVLPSYLETFGHPLLEAMACGVPIVASEYPVFREITGDAAIYADPFDVSEISRAMEEALRPEVAADLVRRGSQRVTRFSLEHTVDELSNLFESVLGVDQQSI